KFALIATAFGANAVLGTTPSCSHWRQLRSNCDVALAAAVGGGVAAVLRPAAVMFAAPRFAFAAPDAVAAATPGTAGAAAAAAAAALTVPAPVAAPGLLQYARTRSYPGRSPLPLSAAI